MFYKLLRRNFSYHHNFDPSKMPSNNALNTSIAAFDMLRILCYLFVGIKLAVKLPQLTIFNTLHCKKFNNNPDYRLCESLEEFKKV